MTEIPLRLAGALALAAALAAGPAAGQPAENPDWPCMQRLVPQLSPGLIWSGPPLDEAAGTWQEDEAIRSLVGRVTARAVPEEEAIAAVEAFAESLPPDQREATLTRLLAGIFERLNAERAGTIGAALTYGRNQRQILQGIDEQLQEAETVRREHPEDVQRQQAIDDRIYWARRVFEDRRRMQTAVCDQPVLLEERLGALARAIASHLG